MKNSVKHFFFLTTFLLLGSAFTSQSASTTAGDTDFIVSYGGAYVMFAGKYGGEIPRSEIAGQTEIKVEGCVTGARIFDFTLAITKGGKTRMLRAKSNVLTADMQTQLKSLNKGDVFEFQHTKAYLANGRDVVDARGSKFIVI